MRPAPLLPLSTLACLACVAPLRGQEIEPRAYSPAPTGANFFVLGYANSSGEVLTDPSLPVEDVEAEIDAAVYAYGRTFALADHIASFAIAVPYLQADVTGMVGDARGAVDRSGLGDTRMRFAVNILNGPALQPYDFARAPQKTTLGASLVVAAPTGQYDENRLINIGTNRWAFKPEIGVSHPWNNWYFDAYAGVWLYTENDEYYGGVTRDQDPLWSLQGHVSYEFRPRLWVAADATFYTGGETKLDGVARGDRKSNTRIGVTVSLPIGQSQSLKFNWNRGATTRTGSDFTTFGIAWQMAWFDTPES